jgi:hypothetical protein
MRFFLAPPGRFNVAKKYWHDVTVATDAVLCVVRNGTGLDINVDYHRAGEG